MSKPYVAFMLVLVVAGIICTVLAQSTMYFAAGLSLVIIGAAGLSAGYVTFLDDEPR